MKNNRYHCPLRVEVLYPDEKPSQGAHPCIIGQDISFNADHLEAYVPSGWDPIILDVMVVAAAVEVCDHSRARSEMDWGRDFTLTIPVHDAERWNAPTVKQALLRALKVLTGDLWKIDFRETPEIPDVSTQGNFDFPPAVDIIIPFSDGLDSRSVAGLIERNSNEKSMRVRVGANRIRKASATGEIKPFANLPFKVRNLKKGNAESSGRSRGFKFGLMAGLAAHLLNAKSVIVPESGQGALGPVMVATGQTYLDRRTHPQFTHLMSDLMEALFGSRIVFEHPRLWSTKGETLAAYKHIFPDDLIWKETRSCWTGARHSSVNGSLRQCGVCAACMLRRTSLHASGYNEDPANYVWENLNSSSFWEGAHADYINRSAIRKDYAIAGVLHMDHIAALRTHPDLDYIVQRQALQLAKTMNIPFEDTCNKIKLLIEAHSAEWSSFVQSLSSNSFVHQWAEAA